MLLDSEIAKLRRKLKSDETVDDDWSEPGDDQTDEQNDGDEQDDEEEDTPRRRAAKAALGQIEDEVERIEKAIRYPNSADYPAVHTSMPVPQVTVHSAHGGGSYSTGVWPTTQEPATHPFDDKVKEIMARDGVSKMVAMSRARIEDPASFTSYQRWHAGGTAQDQETARGWSMDDPMSKLGAPHGVIYPQSDHPIKPDKTSHRRRVKHHDQQVEKLTWESAVNAEIRKGCTPEIAAVRIANAFGTTLPHDDYIAKGLAAADAVQSQFYEAADDYVDAEAHSPRCEALRKCRLANPTMFKSLQAL